MGALKIRLTHLGPRCVPKYIYRVYDEVTYIFMIVRVGVGIVNKRGENMKGIITWDVFTRSCLTELCLSILFIVFG